MLFHIWAGVVGIGVGRYVDTCGPRRAQIGGALLMAAGVLGLGVSDQLWHTYVAFLLLSTGFAGLHNVTLGKVIAKWFQRDRARAMALATLGTSVGGMLIVPLSAFVFQEWGGLAGGLLLAGLTLGIVLPLALWVIHDSPAVLGLAVDGGVATTAGETGNTEHAYEYTGTLAQAVRTRAFWALAVSFPCVVMAQAGFTVHQVLIYQPTFGLLGAAGIVTLGTSIGVLSRLGFLYIGPAWPSRHMASGIYLLEACGLACLAFGSQTWVLLANVVLLGFCMSLTVTLEPVIASECFGQRAFGRLYGPIYGATRLAAALGALLYGVLADAAGSYHSALCVMAVALMIAAGGIQWAVPPAAVAPGRA